MTAFPTPLSVYRLHIVLRGISPLIWRRVLVPSHITLAHLDTILQIVLAMGDGKNSAFCGSQAIHAAVPWAVWTIVPGTLSRCG